MTRNHLKTTSKENLNDIKLFKLLVKPIDC